MALPAVLLKAKSAISKGAKAAKIAKAIKSATSNSNEEEVKSFFSVFKIPILLVSFIAIFILIVFAMIITIPQVLYSAVFGGDSGSSGGSYTGDIAYVQWAVDIANDETHGYSQCARNGPDYDCSSLVYYSLLNTGYTQEELGGYAFATSREFQILPQIGFDMHSYNQSELQPGDILWRDGHTGIYVGDGQVVEASSSRQSYPGMPFGYCGDTGDQDGTEVWVHENSNNWTHYFRKS